MLTLKIHDSGLRIDNLPDKVILRDARAPEPVTAALDAYSETVEARREPMRALREAKKAAYESTLLVRGERARYLAEIAEKVAPEAKALKAADRRMQRAAEDLVRLLEQHADQINAIGARLALVAHADAVDRTMDLEEARARYRLAPPVPDHPQVDPATMAEQRVAHVRFGPFGDLDRVNVAALIEVAGEDPVGFVEVVDDRFGFRMLTTTRRAEALTAGRTSTWSYVHEIEEGDE